MTLESLVNVFENLKSTYQILIRVFQVLAQSPCDDPKYQMLIRVFQGWEPLQHPMHGLEVMSLWQRLLQGNEPRDYGIYTEEEHSSSTPYTQLFTEVILLAVRIDAANSWELRDPEPMLRVLETWENLLLALVLHNILDFIVMPKLIVAIDTWDAKITRAQK